MTHRVMQHLTVVILCTLSGISSCASAVPPHGSLPGTFDASDGASVDTGTAPAAVVNGHIISLAAVTDACLREDRAQVVDVMIQNYVIDRECRKRGLIIPEAAIDERITALRQDVLPQTLEQVIAAHHSTMAEVRDDFRRQIARTRLVADQVPPAKMAHCRAITIKYRLPGMPVPLAGTTRTAAEAQTLLTALQTQLKAGASFSTVAAQRSSEDLGILYPGKHDVDPAVVSAALRLDCGAVSLAQVPLENSYCLLQAASTSTQHAPGEDALYADARRVYQEQQAQFFGPKLVVSLIENSKITFADLSPGQPLPSSAAVVDGYPIPMPAVVAACLAEDGPRLTDILVQNYVVDRECRRRGLQVTDAQIDRRVNILKTQIAPHTIEEGLTAHHLTMDTLRSAFRQDIERTLLVQDEVKPVQMVHCRLVTVPFRSDGEPAGVGTAPRTEAEAKMEMLGIEHQLKEGKDFAALSTDAGIFYPGMHDVDTAVLEAGLSLGRGQSTPAPIRTREAYCVVEAVSTRSDHAADEDARYAEAWGIYREQQSQPLIPTMIRDLLKKSKVVYYIRA